MQGSGKGSKGKGWGGGVEIENVHLSEVCYRDEEGEQIATGEIHTDGGDEVVAGWPPTELFANIDEVS